MMDASGAKRSLHAGDFGLGPQSTDGTSNIELCTIGGFLRASEHIMAQVLHSIPYNTQYHQQQLFRADDVVLYGGVENSMEHTKRGRPIADVWPAWRIPRPRLKIEDMSCLPSQ